ALTLGAGSTAGTVPVQRLWYLGGAYTVRGQDAGAAVGNALWMGRAEVGTSFAAARPVVFYDVGWAGDRADFASSTLRPLQGVGVGASFLDGMIRFDLSRGLTPGHGVHADMYLEARF
ncbi:MAG TPA: ShlB/FhaC/HecB family hemolysin secretion/activation protein, partial [Longimicrobiaceae bacterium]|nr:ShlB/FhaC/HecB family hemolysin secretion/activation protein [Longimicrobiaceae bacterium]